MGGNCCVDRNPEFITKAKENSLTQESLSELSVRHSSHNKNPANTTVLDKMKKQINKKVNNKRRSIMYNTQASKITDGSKTDHNKLNNTMRKAPVIKISDSDIQPFETKNKNPKGNQKYAKTTYSTIKSPRDKANFTEDSELYSAAAKSNRLKIPIHNDQISESQGRSEVSSNCAKTSKNNPHDQLLNEIRKRKFETTLSTAPRSKSFKKGNKKNKDNAKKFGGVISFNNINDYLMD